MNKLSIHALTLLATVLVSSDASAALIGYSINATGAAEVTAGGVPNQGDPDGSAIGFIIFDNVAGSAQVSLNLANIDLTTLSGHHIHQAPATTTGGIVLDLGDPDTIRTGSVLSGTITGLSTATINNINASPTGFYYNLHNTAFPGGAVRSQLPEPASLSFVALVTMGLMARRRYQ